MRLRLCLLLQVMGFAFVLPIAISAADRSRRPSSITHITNNQDTTQVTSLRGAIIAANRLGGHHTIILTCANYELTLQGTREDAALTGDLDVTRGSLTIMGCRTSRTTISASRLGDRVFHVMHGARLTLINVAIIGDNCTSYELSQSQVLSGITPTDGGGGDQTPEINGQEGGGIYNAGTLVLKNCIISGNTSGSGQIPSGPPGNGPPAEPRGYGGDGGGIKNIGSLLIEGCVIAENSCGLGLTGGRGGGICNSGVAILNNCILSNNFGGLGDAGFAYQGFGGNGGGGGAIFNSGAMSLNNCTISANAGGNATDSGFPYGAPGGTGGSGAGVYNDGWLKLKFCTVSGNHSGTGGSGALSGHGFNGGRGGLGGAGGSGSGIYNKGTLTLNTCTISSNFAGNGGRGGDTDVSIEGKVGGAGGNGGYGGGICNFGKMELLSCTIAQNSTGGGGTGGANISRLFRRGASGGDGGSGGGLFSGGTNSLSLVRNTLVALNSLGIAGTGGIPTGMVGADGDGPDTAGEFSSGGYNLIGEAQGSVGLTNAVNRDLVGYNDTPIDPLLGPLQDNGGPTLTHALLHGSPAIDTGRSFAIHRDQRGQHRPFNYPLIPGMRSGDSSDIGAYELHVP